jgi:hypothetical protein
MDADQLAEGIARAVEAAKPAQEYCFLWIDHWSMCMTKAEWSGWMQAIGSVVALLIAIWIPWRERKLKKIEDQKQAAFVADLAVRFHSELLDSNEAYLRVALAHVPQSFDERLRPGAAEEVAQSIKALRFLDFEQIKLIYTDSKELGRYLTDFRCELYLLQEFMQRLERTAGFDEFELKRHEPTIRARLEKLSDLKDLIRNLTTRGA